MARNIDDIQRDIERARRQLASTLDEIADRTKPQHLVEEAKAGVIEKFQDPQFQKVVAGVCVAVVAVVALGVRAAAKRKKDLKELQALLASRA